MKIETIINFTFIFLLGAILGARFLPPKTPEPIYQQSDICIRAIPDLEEWYYVELLGRVIYCESGGNSKVRNLSKGYFYNYKGQKIAYAGNGLCQFVWTTWKYTIKKTKLDLNNVDIFNYGDNLRAGLWLLSNEGSRHWEPSRHCWSKL